MPAAPCRGQLPCFRFTLPSRSKEQTCVSSEPVFSPGRQGCGGLACALLFSLETSALAKGCGGPRPPAQLRSVRGGVRAAAASPAGGVRPGPSISQGFPARRCLALSGECCQWLSRSGLAAWKDESVCLVSCCRLPCPRWRRFAAPGIVGCEGPTASPQVRCSEVRSGISM